jgi:hypothetical protein
LAVPASRSWIRWRFNASCAAITSLPLCSLCPYGRVVLFHGVTYRLLEPRHVARIHPSDRSVKIPHQYQQSAPYLIDCRLASNSATVLPNSRRVVSAAAFLS